MKYQDIVVVKRWIPILKEYERTRAKVTPRPFKFVKNLCEAHHISKKELSRYYRKWLEGGRKPESLLPDKRGPKTGSRRTPKEKEQNIIKAYRRFGSNRYELVLLFKPYYLDKTPSPATMDRIKVRYPLNKSAKRIIKRYEKQAPGELAHIDISKVTKDIRCTFKVKELYIAALCDDCTRITYAEILRDRRASTLTYFMARSLSWFKQIYTKPYRPQTNGKVEAFFKIAKNEFFYPNRFESEEDVILNLGNFLFEYNHLRRHGGLNYETPFDKLQKVTELVS